MLLHCLALQERGGKVSQALLPDSTTSWRFLAQQTSWNRLEILHFFLIATLSHPQSTCSKY